MNLRDFVRLHKKQSAIAGVVVAIFFVFYFIFFFSVGMRFGGSFFTKSVENGTAFYIGLLNESKTNISVSGPKGGVTSITYQMEGYEKKTYLVTLGSSVYDSNTNYPIHITNENGKELFDGNLLHGHLFNKNGEPIFDDPSGDTPTAIEITRIALHQYDAIRGNPPLLALAMFLFLIAILHSMFPLAIFLMLRYMMGVEDPQPSNRYLTAQKVIWSIIPVVGLAFLINAILV